MDYFRKNIQDMTAYTPGLQLNDPGIIKLNTNENPFPPPDSVIKALKENLDGSLRLYPDPLANGLRDTIARTYNLTRENVIAGNGSDEILSLIFRAFIDPGDTVLLFYPTYSLYEVLAHGVDATTIELELTESFTIPENTYAHSAKLCCIPNPNVPGGNYLAKKDLARLAKSLNGILVIDEAYVDFAEDNCIDLIEQHENVIVTRSFSKSFSLAGLRIGYALSNPQVIAGLMKIKDSYNLNRLSAVAAQASLEALPEIKQRCNQIKQIRDETAHRLQAMGFEVLPSQTNFLFVKPPSVDAQYLYEALLNRKILVRYFNQCIVNEYLRITIGLRDDMEVLINTLKELI